jgi:sugar phosphate isomerase/epimerase
MFHSIIAMTDPTTTSTLTRRDFLAHSGLSAALLAAAPLLGSALTTDPLAAERRPAPSATAKTYPIGIELYAVRTELQKDLPNTLRTVKGQGYQVVEFYAPYLGWTIPYAKSVRTMLDDLGLRCYSTHNGLPSLVPGDAQTKAIEINQILGARHIILSSPGMQTGTIDEWKELATKLTAASEALRPHGLMAGMHNHDAEWVKLADGQRVMELIAANTPADFVLQLDVGTCVKAGADPVAWVMAHPGRIRSAHLKDWAPGTEAQEKAYRVLFGEGVAPWKPLLAALETTGGVEYYLMEQEGSRFSEFDTARRCLDNWTALRRTL